jgi:biotin transport system substrate-specific component
VPVTGQTFAVLLAGAAIGPLRGILAMLLYSFAGLVGVPWFAGGASGYSSASFGYIIGFIAATGLVGWLANRGWTRTAIDTALAMVLGNVVIYAIGVTWLKFAIDTTWSGAIAMGMSPFLLGDAFKIAIAAGLFPLIWRQLDSHGLVGSGRSGETAPAESVADDSDYAVLDLTKAAPAEDTIDLRDGATAEADAAEPTER